MARKCIPGPLLANGNKHGCNKPHTRTKLASTAASSSAGAVVLETDIFKAMFDSGLYQPILRLADPFFGVYVYVNWLASTVQR